MLGDYCENATEVCMAMAAAEGRFYSLVVHEVGKPFESQWDALHSGATTTSPSPLPLASFGFEPAIPSLWPRVPTYPGRDPWRGGVRGPLKSRAVQLRKEGLGYDIEGQEK